MARYFIYFLTRTMSTRFILLYIFRETDCYGFERDRNLDKVPYQEFISDYIPTLARRTRRWEKLYRPSKVDHLPNGLFANRKGTIPIDLIICLNYC